MENSKLSIFIILIPTPDFHHFYYMLGGNLGSLLYGDVSVVADLIEMYMICKGEDSGETYIIINNKQTDEALNVCPKQDYRLIRQ